MAAAVVSDAAKGRSLLDSEALAVAEVARQLRLPLAAVALRPADGHATSWFTAAHARLGELTQRLVGAKLALRAKVASEGSAAAAAGAGGDADAAWRWAARAAGAGLSQPTPMQSAYGVDPPPTHVVPRYANTLDWIFIDGEQLEVVGVAPLPPLHELMRDVAMPSAEFPSDHVSLCCILQWR